MRRTLRESELEGEDFTAALRGKRILLAEDHPLNAEIATRLLEKADCTVLWVENGLRAVEQIRKSQPGYFDAVLMDIRMPVMDGLEAAKHIRALGGEYAAGVPIVAMSANAFEEDKKKSLAAGMSARLAKPVKPGVLYETLSGFLK